MDMQAQGLHSARRAASGLLVGAIVVAALALTSVPASSHFVPSPCDFITGGGWVRTDAGAFANFGAHGGCKNDGFWGHVNYLDHNSSPPYHVRSLDITGYLIDPAFPNARDICGTGVTNKGELVTFRVRMEDNGEPGKKDRFGIRLSNGYLLTTRELGPAGDAGGGGNIQLHKPNPSTTGPVPPPAEWEMCGVLTPP